VEQVNKEEEVGKLNRVLQWAKHDEDPKLHRESNTIKKRKYILPFLPTFGVCPLAVSGSLVAGAAGLGASLADRGMRSSTALDGAGARYLARADSCCLRISASLAAIVAR
jgi:hypothetical protein